MKKSELNSLSQDNQAKLPASKHREHDPQLQHQVSSLLQRIQNLRKQSTPLETLDYQTLRQQYEAAANQEVRQLQQEAQQHRIERLIAQADLNPEWLFERMDHGDPTLEYAIQTARSFISGFEHWEQNGGSCVLIYGGYGTGKSTLAGAIAHELIAQHQKSVVF